MRRDCFGCGYCKREVEDGEVKYYCNDLDCYVEPDEPSCSDENYDS